MRRTGRGEGTLIVLILKVIYIFLIQVPDPVSQRSEGREGRKGSVGKLRRSHKLHQLKLDLIFELISQDLFGVGRKVAVEIVCNALGDHFQSPLGGVPVMTSLYQ